MSNCNLKDLTEELDFSNQIETLVDLNMNDSDLRKDGLLAISTLHIFKILGIIKRQAPILN